MDKHLEQTLPSVYTLQCLTGKVDNNNNNNNNYRTSAFLWFERNPVKGHRDMKQPNLCHNYSIDFYE